MTKLNDEQLKRDPILLDTEDLLDTIADLQRQLRERDDYILENGLRNNPPALDAYVQEKVEANNREWRNRQEAFARSWVKQVCTDIAALSGPGPHELNAKIQMAIATHTQEKVDRAVLAEKLRILHRPS